MNLGPNGPGAIQRFGVRISNLGLFSGVSLGRRAEPHTIMELDVWYREFKSLGGHGWCYYFGHLCG
jgi:hypothetical protein